VENLRACGGDTIKSQKKPTKESPKYEKNAPRGDVAAIRPLAVFIFGDRLGRTVNSG
jgi:hypothetical protein